VYGRINDCWNRPICSAPGAKIDVIKRIPNPHDYNLVNSKNVIRCLNLGSYNYLGFAENNGRCTNDDVLANHKFSTSVCSSRLSYGTISLHQEVEKAISQFLHKEDAFVCGMGFGTNSSCIAGIIGKGGLIISDSLNHASLVNGCRISGATVKVFKHNDVKDLERILQQSLYQAHKANKKWDKILIIIEGLYSMEGDISPLPEIIKLKKKI